MAAIEFDQVKLRAAIRALDAIGGEANQAMMRAINRTLDGVNTDAARAIATELNLTQANIKKNFSKFTATRASVKGTWRSKGKPVKLIDYGAIQVAGGVAVKIKKNRPKKIIKHAFVTTMKSKHKGAFQRTTDKVGTGRPIGNTATLHLNFPGRWERKYRLPIKELHGPRVEDILENPPVMGDTLEKASVRLNARLEHEVNYILTKAKNA